MDYLSYILFVLLFCMGLFIIISSRNYFKRIIGLNILQGSIIILFLLSGKKLNDYAPLIIKGVSNYSSPIPQVLMLTAIVVGVATSSLAYSFILKINSYFGTINEEDLKTKIKEDEIFENNNNKSVISNLNLNFFS